MLRRSTVPLIAGLALLSLAPGASAATKKKAKAPAPLKATAAFPDGSTQTWATPLDKFLGSDDDYRLVSRPDAATVVFDEYVIPYDRPSRRTGKRKAPKPVRCARIAMHAVLTPSDGTGDPLAIARTLLPTAVMEQGYAFRTDGTKLRGDSTDLRLAFRADGNVKKDLFTDSVTVADWSAGTLHGWRQLAVHVTQAPKRDAKTCAEYGGSGGALLGVLLIGVEGLDE